jgi:nucleoid DNA-binding protein
MNINDFVNIISNELGTKKDLVKKTINRFISLISKEIYEDRKVQIRNFGTFYSKKINHKFKSNIFGKDIYKNQNIDQKVYIKSKKSIRFKGSRSLNNSFNSYPSNEN